MSTANAIFDNALRLHKKADLAAAEPLYRAVLQDDPNHIDANCMLGSLLTQTGRIEESLRLLRKVVSLQPEHFVAHHSLGHALKAQGDVQAAIEQYRKAVRINPNYLEGLNSLGCALRDTHQHEEAAAAFLKLTDVDPTYAPGHFNLGLVHFDRHEFDLAIRRFHDAIDWDTDCFEAYFYLGHAYRDKKDYDQAIAYYNKALHLRPREARIVTDIGTVFQRKKDYSEAQRWYERALSLNPELPEALCNMGTLCQERGAYDDAMTYYEHALGIHPDYVECLIAISDTYQTLGRAKEALASAEYAMYLAPERFRVRLNLGKALLWNHRFEESENQLEWCLSKKPEHADALIHMGLLNIERGRLELALQWFNRIIDKNPLDSLAHRYRGRVLLTLGRLEHGWLEWDSSVTNEEQSSNKRDTYPIWAGENIAGKTILVRMNGSISDAIMISSCIPDLLEIGCHCIIECDSRLIPVFNRSFPAIKVVREFNQLASDKATVELSVDYQISISSLPRYLRAKIESFPKRNSYLVPDPVRVNKWREKLKNIGPGPNVGLAWGEQKIANTTSSDFNIGISDFGKLVAHQSGVFVALVEGKATADAALFKQHYDVTLHQLDLENIKYDIDDLFSLVSALDLVITTNELAFHVAGSLGKPVWFLSITRREWIMLGTEGIPWYPSVECFIKGEHEEWNVPTKQLIERLQKFESLTPQVNMTVESLTEIQPDKKDELEVNTKCDVVPIVEVTPTRNLMYDMALTHYREGDLLAAEDFCQQGLEQNPNDTKLLCLLSTIFVESERGAIALALLEKARRITPDDASICTELAQVYGLLGCTREEVESLAMACELSPENGEYHLNLALSLEKHGNIDGAVLAAQLASLLLLESAEAKALLVRVGFLTVDSTQLERNSELKGELQKDDKRQSTLAVDTLRLLSWDGSARFKSEPRSLDTPPVLIDSSIQQDDY